MTVQALEQAPAGTGWEVGDAVPDHTAASCLFDTAGWLRVWERLGAERRSRHAYVRAAGGPAEQGAPAVLPVYEVGLSPFWHGYEAQTGLIGRFGSPIVFAGSTYSMYTRRGPVPAALARGAYETAMEWIASGPAEVLVVPNLTDEGVRDWVAAVGQPVGTVLLERTYSYDIEGDFAGHLARVTTPKIRRDVGRRLRRGAERGLTVTMLDGEEARALVPQAYPLTVDTSDKNDWPPLFDEASLGGLLDVPGAVLAAARVDGRLVGVFFGFTRGDEVTFLCGGVDYASLHDYSTYIALMYRCTEWAYERGMRRIEWGRDNYRFKERHGLTGTNLWALVYSPTPPPGLAEALDHMDAVLTAYIEGS